ncbi:MAG: V-type proton ATPase subunit E [Acetobacterium sp.]|nr:V-type proton ATPase subunit E [Bacillota bacterium]MCG2730274.1 V-type proton ATPase subunit E [Acetobacterium sp.]
MISIEEKLQVFTQSLLSKERKNGLKIMTEAKNKKAEQIAAFQERITKEKKALENRNSRSIFRDRNKILAEGKNKAKTLELEERNRILLDFNQLIQTKAKEFLTTAVYSKYLGDCIKSIPEIFGDKKQLIVFINNQDLIQLKELFKNNLADYTVEYRKLTKESIGGMIVEDSERLIYCDFTVENLITTNYKYIGMTLNAFMENRGELNDGDRAESSKRNHFID